jgi:hypothetical protein
MSKINLYLDAPDYNTLLNDTDQALKTIKEVKTVELHDGYITIVKNNKKRIHTNLKYIYEE